MLFSWKKNWLSYLFWTEKKQLKQLTFFINSSHEWLVVVLGLTKKKNLQITGRQCREKCIRFITQKTIYQSSSHSADKGRVLKTSVAEAESEVFGWSWIPNNIRSRSQIFYSTPNVQQNHFLHGAPKWGTLTHACWNGIIYFETFIETEN